MLHSWHFRPGLYQPVDNSSSFVTSAASNDAIPTLPAIITSFSNLQASSEHVKSPTISLLHQSTNLANSNPIIQEPRMKPCPGYTVSWSAGSVWTTYPYHQHGTRESMGWTPIAFQIDPNTIVLQANTCSKEIPESNTLPCTSCGNIEFSSSFVSFVNRAKEAKAHTPWDYLTSEQLQTLLNQMSAQLKLVQTKVRFCFFKSIQLIH